MRWGSGLSSRRGKGRIADKHSYEVERDYWEWEATVTDEERLRQMLESLP